MKQSDVERALAKGYLCHVSRQHKGLMNVVANSGMEGLVAGRLQSAVSMPHTICVNFMDSVVSDGKSSSNF